MFTEEEIISDLQKVASTINKVPSKNQYDEHGKFSSATIARRLGGWNRAIENIFNINKPSPKPIKEQSCLSCGSKTKNPKFCSQKCSATYNNKKTNGRKTGRKMLRTKKKCSFCKKSFLPNKQSAKYCSECNNKSIVKTNNNKYIEIEKATKADLLTKDTQRYRRIRMNARKVAQDNNQLDKCCVCGYSKHVECSHYKSIASFNNDALISEINHPTNLHGLCRNHHWEYENYQMSKKDMDKLKKYHNIE